MIQHISVGRFAVVALSAAVFAAAAPALAKPEVVTIDLGYAPGSIVIVNSERKIYYVTGGGKAIRYGVAVGKPAELWTGRTFVSDKKLDPKWIPIDGSEPVEGGDPANPLGKRALYLDWSLLRIHGTPSRGSIGSAVSNGCVRMLNEDVIDLFERVHVGAPVFAINSRQQAGAFKSAKAADLIYVNPEARLDEKSEELDPATEQRLREQLAVKEREASLTPAAAPRVSPRPQRQVQYNVPGPSSSPRYAVQYRSGLGRSPFDSGR
jgi:hypothetical protein